MTTAKQLYDKIDPYVVERIRSILSSPAVASGSGGGSIGGAPVNASYLVIAPDSTLTAERSLLVSTALSMTDTGPNNALTIGMALPQQVSATSTNVATAGHSHEVVASSAPGANEALLKSDGDGALTLVKLTATERLRSPLLDTASGGLTFSPADGTAVLNGSLAARGSAATEISATTAADGAIPTLALYRARGSIGSPSAVQNGDALGIVTFGAYHSGGAYSSISARLGAFATEDHSADARGGALAVFTTETGTTIPADRQWWHGSGNVTVGTSTDSGYKFDVSGTMRATTSLTTAQVISPLLTTASNVDLVINPAGTGAVQFPNDQTLRTSDFDSSFPIEGWQINEIEGVAGYSNLTIGKIKANELSVDVFVANETRVDRGNQYWTKSYGVGYAGFTSPSAIDGTVSIVFEDSPALSGAIFSNDDWLLFQSIDTGTGIDMLNLWGQVSGYVDGTGDDEGTQTWTFTLRSGPTNTPVLAGQVAVDFGASGAALIHLSTIDDAGAPYIKMRRWFGANPYTPSNFTTYVQIGNLGSIGNSYYTPAGYGLYIRSSAAEDQFIVADDNGLQLRGASLTLWDGATQTVNIDNEGVDIWVGNGSDDKLLAWDGSALSLRANNTDVITLDTSGNSYFAGIMTIGTSGEIRQGTGTLGSNYTGLRIWRDSSVGRIAGYNNNVQQWYASTDGKLYAGGGTFMADAAGIHLANGSGGAAGFQLYRTSTFSNSNKAGGLWALSDLGNNVYLYAGRSTGLGDAANASGLLSLTGYDSSGGGVSITLNGSNNYIGVSGQIRTETIRPIITDTYDIGTSSAYYENAYIRNLHIDTIVGTPSYSHTHASSEITSGTLDLARIPTNLTGKNADLLDGYDATDFALVGHNHDSRYYTETEIDALLASASTHNHDDRYYTETESDARYSQLGHTHDDRYYTRDEIDGGALDGAYVEIAGSVMTGDLIMFTGALVQSERFQANGTILEIGSSAFTTGIYVDGSFVGINTAAPDAALDVTGDATVSGTIVASGAITGASFATAGTIRVGDGSSGAPGFSFGSDTNTGIYRAGADQLGFYAGATLLLSASGLTYNSNTVWHAGNDGSGSGLDADTIDGLNLSDLDDRWLLLTGGTLTGNLTIDGDAAGALGRIAIATGAGTNEEWRLTGWSHDNGTTALRGDFGLLLWDGSADQTIFAVDRTARLVQFTTTPTVGASVMWHAGNDGASSGLDADLLRGVAGTSYLRKDSAGTITVAHTIATTSGLGPPFILGSNNIGQKVVGFNAEFLDGMDSTDFALAAHNHNDLYYLQTESDLRYAALVHNHSTLQTPFTFVNGGTDLVTVANDGDLQSATFLSGQVGYSLSTSGDAEFRSITARGNFTSSIFSYRQMSVTAGDLFVGPGGRLLSDFNAADDDYMDIEDPPQGHATVFTVDSILRIKGLGYTVAGEDVALTSVIPDFLMIPDGILTSPAVNIYDNWFKVTSVEDMGTFYRYHVTHQFGNRCIYPVGSTVASYGLPADGRIVLTSDNAYGPYIDLFTSGASPWDGTTGNVRIGNLAGLGVIDGDEKGLAAGEDLSDPDSAYLIASNEQILLNNVKFLTRGDGKTRVRIEPDGRVFFGPDVSDTGLLNGRNGFYFDSNGLYIGNDESYIEWLPPDEFGFNGALSLHADILAAEGLVRVNSTEGFVSEVGPQGVFSYTIWNTGSNRAWGEFGAGLRNPGDLDEYDGAVFVRALWQGTPYHLDIPGIDDTEYPGDAYLVLQAATASKIDRAEIMLHGYVDTAGQERGEIEIEADITRVYSPLSTYDTVHVFAKATGNRAFHVNEQGIVLLEDLPTDPTDLPRGAIWNDQGTLKIT